MPVDPKDQTLEEATYLVSRQFVTAQQEQAVLSIAISLKRIADALESKADLPQQLHDSILSAIREGAEFAQFTYVNTQRG